MTDLQLCKDKEKSLQHKELEHRDAGSGLNSTATSGEILEVSLLFFFVCLLITGSTLILGSQFINWDKRKRWDTVQELPSDEYSLVPWSAQPHKTCMRESSS